MKYLILSAALFGLVACQASDSDPGLPLETDAPATESAVTSGQVTLRLMDAVSEPRACILPIRVENGLGADVNVTAIDFDITGPGEDAKGNMFAPVAAAGEVSEARVIIEGQSCDAYDMIRIPEVRCTSADEDCSGKVELIGSDGIGFSQAG